MARKKTTIEPTVETEASQPVEIQHIEPEPVPEPVLNRGPQGWVKVRALVNIGEPDRSGNMTHRKAGDVFEVQEERARVIAGLVKRE